MEKEIKKILYGVYTDSFNRFSNMLIWLENNKNKCTPKEYCYAIINAYNDSDNLYWHKKSIKKLFTDPMVEPKHIMSPKDYDEYQNLPDIITVYRGMTVKEALSRDYGISWTLSREVAEFFATRYGRNYSTSHMKKTVVQRQVQKSKIIGMINDRKEQEILIC